MSKRKQPSIFHPSGIKVAVNLGQKGKTMNPLPNKKLALTAQRLLFRNGGFTLDEFGNSITGDLWAVSVKGKEQQYSYLPSLQLIENYLLKHGRMNGGAYFGGWRDDDGVYYLDHTLTFCYKHTAVNEARRQHQKAIFHLGRKETFQLGEAFRQLSDPQQAEIQTRRDLVRQLCDEYNPYVILADVGLYLENSQGEKEYEHRPQ